MKRCQAKMVSLVWCLLPSVCWPAGASADEVIYRDSRGKQHRRLGTVTDYSSAGLVIESNGRSTTLPIQGVEQIETEWDESHRRGNALFEQHDYPAALSAYREAFQGEPRGWVKRKLLARVVNCQQNSGLILQACANFVRLVEDDAGTPYFSAIPLAWGVQSPDLKLRQLARDWIGQTDKPTRQLIAASWLLTAEPSRSTKTLRKLARESRPKISGLAVAQFWRTQLTTPRDGDVERWQTHIATLPAELRGGPYYLLGRRLIQLGRRDEAALALMRVPALYGDNALLAQSALFESATAMREQGEMDDARRLYRQAIARGKGTRAGRAAAEGLAAMAR